MLSIAESDYETFKNLVSLMRQIENIKKDAKQFKQTVIAYVLSILVEVVL